MTSLGRCICGGEGRCGYCRSRWCLTCGQENGPGHRCPPDPPAGNVIEFASGRAFPETAWTRQWERTLRHQNWVEHGGYFYPRGTPPALMTGRRTITPPVRRLGSGR